MLATNHALTGAVIGAYLPLPIAVPAAFASHFVLDAIPHYGIKHGKRNHSRTYKLIVFCDTFVALSIAFTAALLHKWHMEITGWVAWSPDLLWVIYYFAHGRDLHLKPKNWFMRFHMDIQWSETPKGILVELVLLAILLPVYISQVLR